MRTSPHIILALSLAIFIPCETGVCEVGQSDLKVSWDRNLLRIHSPKVPGGSVEVWYLEAFCRKGSTAREWSKTVIPHKTVLIESDPRGKSLRLESHVGPDVTVFHTISAGTDEINLHLTLTNHSAKLVDIEWAQPCIRVGRFTGLDQQRYIRKCFIFTEKGLTTLDRTERIEEALYHGGQVYVPPGINRKDVNPRPLSPEKLSNGLIGCFSTDEKMLLATAWNRTQELFQGVITCIHSDFRVGGLSAGETREVEGKIYLMDNDPGALLASYREDFPNGSFLP